ncbi:MAG: hypothetical protein R3F16_03500 [Myxococcota bacterium]
MFTLPALLQRLLLLHPLLAPKPELLEPVFHRLVACSGFRQIARKYGVSTPPSEDERPAWAALLLFHERRRPVVSNRAARPRRVPGFEHSQYWPMDLNLVVGGESLRLRVQ